MARLPAKLECPDGAAIDPGGRLRCRLLVYNASDQVDEVSVAVQGPVAPWLAVTPGELSLLPRTEGTFEVALDLPTDARLEAGPHPLLVEARSSLPDVEPSLEEVEVDVGRHTEAEVSLHHRRGARRGTTSYRAEVENRSNHPLTVALEAETRVHSVVDPPRLTVAPFASASSRITLARERDDRDPVELTVRARGDGVDATDAATWTAGSPWLPPYRGPTHPEGDDDGRRPLVRAIGALLVLAVVLVAAYTIYGLIDRTRSTFDTGDFPVLEVRQPRIERDSWELFWQVLLRAQGHDLGSEGVDGRFGPQTRTATLAFQQEQGLSTDGTVDAADWERMLELRLAEGDPTDVRGWRIEAAVQLVRALGLEPVLADASPCQPVGDVVVLAERTGRTVSLVISRGPPC